jgi:phospholipid/cholesterol/gamma-HCH transport system substrate-binding protein
MSRAFRLGLFVVSTLAILAAGIFLIGERQFLFSSTYQLKTTFKNVAGLNNGAEVRVGGIHKGTVERIQLPTKPGGDMTVFMELESATKKIIRTDSVALIQTEGLLGNKYVEISFGSDEAATVTNGSSIGSVPPLDIADLMRKTNEILDTTKQTMSNVQDSSERFSEITSKIDQGVGTVGALVNDRKVYEQLNEASAQARLGAAAFQENMQALKNNFLLRGFFNRRGYGDSTRLTQHEIADLPSGTYLKRFTYDPTKIFADVNTAKLKNDTLLREAGLSLEANPFGVAVVVASSGMKGDTEELRTLMRARAMVVRDYLVKNFRMDDSRVKTMWVGKRQSTSDVGTVDIVVYPAESTVGVGGERVSRGSHRRQVDDVIERQDAAKKTVDVDHR